MTSRCFQSVRFPNQLAPRSASFPPDFDGQVLKLSCESGFIVTVRMAGKLRRNLDAAQIQRQSQGMTPMNVH